MNKELLLKNLRSIPDFPIPGILFRDVTSLFKSAECMKELDDTLYEMYKDCGITKVVGIESRGFVMGAALAVRLGAGFVPVRKPGKLPAETISESYSKEYGTDTIEIHKDAIEEGDIVLLHDDLLATGGTMLAAYNLVKKSPASPGTSNASETAKIIIAEWFVRCTTDLLPKVFAANASSGAANRPKM
ncbi:MAG: adenine phosphoribosyltransferase [Bacteroidaceae bacterium]|nr:adenine phosphoribosyltransferase [Bacteroidaceae bacterium]